MDADPIARVYAPLERIVYGRALQRARCAQLGNIGVPRRALLVGEGDGRFLQAFLERFPDCATDVVEPSRRMTELIRKRIGDRPKVRLFTAEIDRTPLAENDYDLIAAHFFFDCLETDAQHAVALKMARWLRSGGKLIVAEFQLPPQGRLARMRARCLLATMYRFFRLASGLRTRSLSDCSGALDAAGFRLADRIASNAAFVRSDRWHLPESAAEDERRELAPETDAGA